MTEMKENETIEEAVSEAVETEEQPENAEEIDPVAELEEKLREQTDKYLRLMAEYDNYQKRSQREKAARYADAVIDTAAQLLPIGDALSLALKTEVSSEEAVKFKEGIDMVLKQFNDCLNKLEITPIKAIGEQFDPNLHNAVMHIEDESIDENTIVEEFMTGYIYKNDRVVRYSMVKVAN